MPLRNRHYFVLDAALLLVGTVLAFAIRFEGLGDLDRHLPDATAYFITTVPVRIAVPVGMTELRVAVPVGMAVPVAVPGVPGVISVGVTVTVIVAGTVLVAVGDPVACDGAWPRAALAEVAVEMPCGIMAAAKTVTAMPLIKLISASPRRPDGVGDMVVLLESVDLGRFF